MRTCGRPDGRTIKKMTNYHHRRGSHFTVNLWNVRTWTMCPRGGSGKESSGFRRSYRWSRAVWSGDGSVRIPVTWALGVYRYIVFCTYISTRESCPKVWCCDCSKLTCSELGLQLFQLSPHDLHRSFVTLNEIYRHYFMPEVNQQPQRWVVSGKTTKNGNITSFSRRIYDFFLQCCLKIFFVDYLEYSKTMTGTDYTLFLDYLKQSCKGKVIVSPQKSFFLNRTTHNSLFLCRCVPELIKLVFQLVLHLLLFRLGSIGLLFVPKFTEVADEIELLLKGGCNWELNPYFVELDQLN